MIKKNSNRFRVKNNSNRFRVKNNSNTYKKRKNIKYKTFKKHKGGGILSYFKITSNNNTVEITDTSKLESIIKNCCKNLFIFSYRVNKINFGMFMGLLYNHFFNGIHNTSKILKSFKISDITKTGKSIILQILQEILSETIKNPEILIIFLDPSGAALITALISILIVYITEVFLRKFITKLVKFLNGKTLNDQKANDIFNKITTNLLDEYKGGEYFITSIHSNLTENSGGRDVQKMKDYSVEYNKYIINLSINKIKIMADKPNKLYEPLTEGNKDKINLHFFSNFELDGIVCVNKIFNITKEFVKNINVLTKRDTLSQNAGGCESIIAGNKYVLFICLEHEIKEGPTDLNFDNDIKGEGDDFFKKNTTINFDNIEGIQCKYFKIGKITENRKAFKKITIESGGKDYTVQRERCIGNSEIINLFDNKSKIIQLFIKFNYIHTCRRYLLNYDFPISEDQPKIEEVRNKIGRKYKKIANLINVTEKNFDSYKTYTKSKEHNGLDFYYDYTIPDNNNSGEGNNNSGEGNNNSGEGNNNSGEGNNNSGEGNNNSGSNLYSEGTILSEVSGDYANNFPTKKSVLSFLEKKLKLLYCKGLGGEEKDEKSLILYFEAIDECIKYTSFTNIISKIEIFFKENPSAVVTDPIVGETTTGIDQLNVSYTDHGPDEDENTEVIRDQNDAELVKEIIESTETENEIEGDGELKSETQDNSELISELKQIQSASGTVMERLKSDSNPYIQYDFVLIKYEGNVITGYIKSVSGSEYEIQIKGGEIRIPTQTGKPEGGGKKKSKTYNKKLTNNKNKISMNRRRNKREGKTIKKIISRRKVGKIISRRKPGKI